MVHAADIPIDDRQTRHAPRSGFSLIELLVVLSIIVILAAMLLPMVGLVRDQARLSQCAGNLRQCSLAVIAYAQEEDGLLPSGETGGTPWWTDRSSPYLDDTYKKTLYTGNNVYHCPFAEREIPNQWNFQDRFSFHFSINLNIYSRWDTGAGRWWSPPVALAQVCSQTVMLADGHADKFGALSYIWDMSDPTGATPWPLQGSIVAPAAPADANNPQIVLHRGRVNQSRMDGHVEAVVGVWSKSAQSIAWATKQ